MIHAYSESYLYDAKQNLAECFDYAISNCRFNADIFFKAVCPIWICRQI